MYNEIIVELTMIKYGVVDLETSVKCPIGKFKASPHWKENTIVLGGLKTNAGSGWYITFDDSEWPILHGLKWLVGQNIKFDLLYLKRLWPDEYDRWVREGGRVWDTQVAEYLLTGQTSKFASLDKLSEKYGGTLKPDAIKAYWEDGYDTEDIPLGELHEYLQGDVLNTELVFLAQYEAMKRQEMVPLFMTQMDALLALVDIEDNGMYVDVDLLVKQRSVLAKERDELHASLTHTMRDLFPDPDNLEIPLNPSSTSQLSAALFGGDMKYKHRLPDLDEDGNVLYYKSGLRKGEPRTKIVKSTVHIDGLFDGDTYSKKGSRGTYSVADDVIQSMATRVRSGMVDGTDHAKFLLDVAHLRTLTKDIGTYYDSLYNLLYPGDFVHPNYNQTNTATGRLSSSKPNAQNISSKSKE
jgi:DNA polymerase I-like protein with 3'-5' exonuclease and polymerase domains